MSKVGLLVIDLQNNLNCSSESELSGFAITAGFDVSFCYSVKRKSIDSKHFIGSGHVESLKNFCAEHNVDQVLVNNDLTASVQKNLANALGVDVVDRTELILYIFSLHARTFEGKLQVELAQLIRLSTRLIRGWTHLERQKGGIGLRGPGETQLETDRRLIKKRIKSIRARLDKVKVQRAQTGRARAKSKLFNVVLVGYTNAGKSTLFNSLTDANVLTANALFATLDPTIRKLNLPGVENAVLVDTVGFVGGLPPEIIEAFHSTLDAVKQADLLIHVVDASKVLENGHDIACRDVNEVLQKLGANKIPVIYAYNKDDLVVDYGWIGKIDSVCYVSALNGSGLGDLREMVADFLSDGFVCRCCFIAFKDAKLRSEYMDNGWVLEEKVAANGWWLLVSFPRCSLKSNP